MGAASLVQAPFWLCSLRPSGAPSPQPGVHDVFRKCWLPSCLGPGFSSLFLVT